MGDIARVFAEVLLPILVAVTLGYAFRRKVAFDLQSINRLCMYVLSPCLVFNTLLRANVSGGDTLRMVAFVVISTLAMGALSFVVGRALRLDRTDQSAFLLATMFMNSGNYGLPLARFAFGEAGFQYAVLFYLGQTILAQTLAVFIAASGRADARKALLQVLRLPLVYAAATALVLRAIVGTPDPATPFVLAGLERGMELVAGAALPVLLLMLGMQLGAAQPVADGGRVTLATALRLVVAAPIAYGIALLLGLGPVATSVGVIQASMPTAVNVTILATEFNVRPQFVSSVVVVSTVLSLLSLTVLLGLMRP